MLGRSAHLQGIIADLVVLTAGALKHPPPASRCVAPRTARLGWGQRRGDGESTGGISWAQKGAPRVGS